MKIEEVIKRIKFEPSCKFKAKEMLDMKFRKRVIRYRTLLLAVLFFLQVAGCGTVMYPERRGQRSGRIDVGIAVLDGLGLLLFIIPGVIAFAVDFSTGAIYLPSGKSKRAGGMENRDLAVINTSPNDLNIAKLDEIVSAYTGEEVNLESNTILVYEADDDKNIERQLKKLAQ
jgi:hypothetical protein